MYGDIQMLAVVTVHPTVELSLNVGDSGELTFLVTGFQIATDVPLSCSLVGTIGSAVISSPYGIADGQVGVSVYNGDGSQDPLIIPVTASLTLSVARSRSKDSGILL